MNPWKQASAQYLAHLKRSGITRLPRPSEALPSALVAWMQQQASAGALVDPIAMEPRSTTTASQGMSQAEPASHSTLASPSQETRSASRPDAATRPSAPLPSEAKVPTAWASPGQSPSQRDEALSQLRVSVDACRLCADIVCRRKQAVFGVGPSTARLVMFGEAPGAEEDLAGIPFVGAAGQLLDKILIASKLKREEVYIMNTLKCRPPSNRTPTESEVENCRPFFEAQLEILQPEYIICWGAIPAKALLRTKQSVGQLRGRFHTYGGAKVLVTYHPAYLLREPSAKKMTWEDMQFLMRDMGIPLK